MTEDIPTKTTKHMHLIGLRIGCFVIDFTQIFKNSNNA